MQSNGNHGREKKKRVMAAWNGWRKVTGVICDRRASAKVKRKVYKSVIEPTMLYVPETVPFIKKQEAELEVAKLKILRFSIDFKKMNQIRNEYIRGIAPADNIKNKLRETRLGMYGHILRRKNNYVEKRMLTMSVPHNKKRGKPRRGFIDAIKEDIKVAGVNEENAMDREMKESDLLWRPLTRRAKRRLYF